MMKFGNPIPEIQCSSSAIPEQIYSSNVPVVLRDLVSDWTLVRKAKESTQSAVDYLKALYNKKPVNAFMALPEEDGRIFYNKSVDGFNFVQANVYLDEVLDKIQDIAELSDQPTYYIGSLEINQHLPAFCEENSVELKHSNTRKSIWLGNQSRIAPHYDFPDNLACCVIGQRKFTLFPPEQHRNLYVGPLDFTPAGQPISMVDIKYPDLTAFPRFEQAMQVAQSTILHPGDAIFIPSMWWHSVESLSALNGLVNFWWRDTPAFMGDPFNALLHSMLSIRELPLNQRKAWQNLFNNYIFEPQDDMYDHLPENVKKAQKTLNAVTSRKVRAQLINKLK
jgi:hypothetical protein